MGFDLRQKKAIGFIFARGGSKGLPGKNLRMLHGKPLLAWAIECARATGLFSKIILSTDDPEIAETGKSYGADVPFLRPPELATDSAPEWLAWRHAVEFVEREYGPFDIFVSIPVVSPLKTPDDIAACVNAFDDDSDIVITCVRSNNHPSFNMVFLDEGGNAALALPVPGGVARRQDARPIYNITAVCYVCSPNFIKTKKGIFDGRVKAVEIPEWRAVDIDTPFDFMLAELLWKRL